MALPCGVAGWWQMLLGVLGLCGGLGAAGEDASELTRWWLGCGSGSRGRSIGCVLLGLVVTPIPPPVKWRKGDGVSGGSGFVWCDVLVTLGRVLVSLGEVLRMWWWRGMVGGRPEGVSPACPPCILRCSGPAHWRGGSARFMSRVEEAVEALGAFGGAGVDAALVTQVEHVEQWQGGALRADPEGGQEDGVLWVGGAAEFAGGRRLAHVALARASW